MMCLGFTSREQHSGPAAIVLSYRVIFVSCLSLSRQQFHFLTAVQHDWLISTELVVIGQGLYRDGHEP